MAGIFGDTPSRATIEDNKEEQIIYGLEAHQITTDSSIDDDFSDLEADLCDDLWVGSTPDDKQM
uniref:Uncharacterized protein n=1 Tax=Solanum demissum TaxID=50514 RepID=Q6L3U2_SOLDE|nr:hypothetical protein SDM1_34t00017 [Solanum demissum]